MVDQRVPTPFPLALANVKVDVDTRRKLSEAELRRRLDRAGYTLLWIVGRPSPSGRGWHRWMRIEPQGQVRQLFAVETVALQLLCGSDPLREAYCLARARQVDAGTVSAYWRTRWNVLYRKHGPELKERVATARGERGLRVRIPSGPLRKDRKRQPESVA